MNITTTPITTTTTTDNNINVITTNTTTTATTTITADELPTENEKPKKNKSKTKKKFSFKKISKFIRILTCTVRNNKNKNNNNDNVISSSSLPVAAAPVTTAAAAAASSNNDDTKIIKVPLIDYNSIVNEEEETMIKEMIIFLNQLNGILSNNNSSSSISSNNNDDDSYLIEKISSVHSKIFQLKSSKLNILKQLLLALQQNQQDSSLITTRIEKVKNVFLPLQEFYNKEFINSYLESFKNLIDKLFDRRRGNVDENDFNKLVNIMRQEGKKQEEIKVYLDNVKNSTIHANRIIAGNAVSGDKSIESEFVKNVIYKTVNRNFKLKLDKYNNDPESLLKSISRDLLEVVNKGIHPRFPSNFGILEHFIYIYNKNVYNYVYRSICNNNNNNNNNNDFNNILRLDDDNNDNLNVGLAVPILTFLNDYYFLFNKVPSGKYSDGFQLLKKYYNSKNYDYLIDRVVDVYVSIVDERLTDWSVGFINISTEKFLKRDRDELDESNGKPGLKNTIIMMDMIRDLSIDKLVRVNNVKLLLNVLSSFNKFLVKMEVNYLDLVTDEYKKHKNNLEINDGLTEYIAAILNDRLRISKFISELNYYGIFNVNVNRNFINKITGVLIGVIFHDINKVFSKLHTKLWYKEDLMGTVIVTLQDYVNSCSEDLMEKEIFDIFILKLLNFFVWEYLKSFNNKNSKYYPRQKDDKKKKKKKEDNNNNNNNNNNSKNSLEKIEKDILESKNFFKSYISDHRLVDEKFEIICKVKDFIFTGRKAVSADYHSLMMLIHGSNSSSSSYNKNNNNDLINVNVVYANIVDSKFLENILSKRDDLSINRIKLSDLNKVIKQERDNYQNNNVYLSHNLVDDYLDINVEADEEGDEDDISFMNRFRELRQKKILKKWKFKKNKK